MPVDIDRLVVWTWLKTIEYAFGRYGVSSGGVRGVSRGEGKNFDQGGLIVHIINGSVSCNGEPHMVVEIAVRGWIMKGNALCLVSASFTDMYSKEGRLMCGLRYCVSESPSNHPSKVEPSETGEVNFCCMYRVRGETVMGRSQE